MKRRTHSSRRGFTLIEIILAIAVLAIGLPAVCYMYAVAMAVDSDNVKGNQAFYLANALMNEISLRRFRESAAAPGNGPDTGETNGYDRRGFDDIDDYNIFKLTWNELKPPRDETGASMTDYADFGQYVEVVNIAAPGTSGSGPASRSTAAVADGSTDFKMVTVRITWQGGKRSVYLSKVFTLPP